MPEDSFEKNHLVDILTAQVDEADSLAEHDAYHLEHW
jgi:hypothetical protein